MTKYRQPHGACVAEHAALHSSQGSNAASLVAAAAIRHWRFGLPVAFDRGGALVKSAALIPLVAICEFAGRTRYLRDWSVALLGWRHAVPEVCISRAPHTNSRRDAPWRGTHVETRYFSLLLVVTGLGACQGPAGSDAPPTVVGSKTFGPNAMCMTGGVTVTVGPDSNRNGKLDADEEGDSFDLCSGERGPSGNSPLVITTAIAPGDECPAGGKRFRLGVRRRPGRAWHDRRKGRRRRDWREPTAGRRSSRPRPKRPAQTAPLVGVRIDAGVDDGTPTGTAGDGVLQAGEIESTRYVCNGANGANGTNGLNGSDGLATLVKMTAEAAGANCASGGTRIDSGTDDGTPTGTARDGVL